jgi:hypothetical protein
MSTKFQNFTSDQFILDSVDCTYLITYNQLKEFNNFPLTNKYFYVENFYNETKKIGSYKLIMDIFSHASINNFNNILIFHQDFKFNNIITDKQIQERLNKSISNINNTNSIYILDCLPLIQLPSINENICILSLFENGIIYPKKFIKTHLKIDIKKQIDNKLDYWSYYLKLVPNIKYTFKKPIVYKLYDENYPFFPILNFFKLNKKYEPGYKSFYLISQIIGCVLLIYIVKFMNFYINKTNNLSK